MSLTKEDIDVIRGQIREVVGPLMDEKFDKFHRESIAPIRVDIDFIKHDIKVLKNDVAYIKRDVVALRNEIDLIKVDVSYLKQWKTIPN